MIHSPVYAFLTLFLLLLLFFIGRFLFYSIDFDHIPEFAAQIERYVQLYGHWSIVAYVVLYVVSASMGLPISPLFMIAAGYLYGFWKGVILSLLSAACASTLLILIVRNGLENWMKERIHPEKYRMFHHLEQYGPWYVLVLQLLPGTPVWLMTVVVALVDMPLPTWLCMSTLGLLPGAVWYNWIGINIQQWGKHSEWFKATFIVSVLLVLLASTIASVVIYRFIKRNSSQKQ